MPRTVPPASPAARRSRARRLLARWLPALAAAPLAAAFLPAAASAAAGPGYVALGDSYTSGPLIPEQTGTPAGCLRSNHNYPAFTAAGTGASLTDVSCGGATTADLTSPQLVAGGINPPQLSALSASTGLVTLQIGGNDVGFISIVLRCASLSLTSPFGSPCKNSYTAGGTDQLAQAISQTAPKVAAVLQGIHQRSPQARVLVVGYPDLLPDTGHGCWPAVPIAYGDVPYLRGVEKELNQMLASQAAGNGAAYVDTYTPSIGHDVCQREGVRWVEGVAPASPAFPMHPNELGEQAMARQVIAAAG
jgi:lysophospholipase L1-like esterase